MALQAGWLRIASALAGVAWVGAGSSAVAVAADPAWVQMVAGGVEARAVALQGVCPTASLDGRPVEMRVRAAEDESFPAACSLTVPPETQRLGIGGAALRLPPHEVHRIVVFGDSGCRIKTFAAQACNDPRAWPFAEVARRAAARHPDLVVHVGDYFYRESNCPLGASGCAGSPSGDRWPAWDADFFAPAAPLLRAAPWVFARGNHESCGRGAGGWFRMLDAGPRPKACPASADAWIAPLGGLNLYVLDSADTVDRATPPDQVSAFAGQIDSLGPALAHEPGWIVTHRPIWGVTPALRVVGLGAVNVPLNLTEQAAVKGKDLDAVRMVVSGHVHDFSSFDFGPDRPAQLLVGTGGDVGEAADSPAITQDQVKLDGLEASRLEFDRFGYLVLDRFRRDGDWTGAFYDAQDRPVVFCRLHLRALICGPAGRR